MSLQQAMSRGDLSPDEFVRLSKDYAAIEPVAAAAREVRRLRAELDVLNGMIADPTAEPELKEMAATEAEEIRHKLPDAERALALKLLPRDAADDRAAMLEVRAGTGGDEAALFAGDLLRMYQRYRRGAGLAVRADLGQRVGARRLQGSGRLDQRPRRVRQAEVRKRRPPRPARAGDRERRAHPHLGGDGRGAARGRGCRRPDRRQGSAHRRLSLVRARAASRSTPPTARSASPTCRPASWSSSRTRNRSTRTRPRRSRCCARGCSSWSASGWRASAPARASRWSDRATVRSASAPIISRRAGSPTTAST